MKLLTKHLMLKHHMLKQLMLLLGLFFFGLLALSFPLSLVEAAPPAQTAQDGQRIFQQKCAACHTIGGGKLVGPDLEGLAARRELSWIRSFIANPDDLIASGDPTAVERLAEYNNLRMPNLGLGQDDVTAVLAYLENPAGAEGGAGSAPVVLPSGEALAGQKLFTGETRLSNGGAACISCHSVAGGGFLGGGTLGPDLTHVAQRYGEAGLASSLNQIVFPTMQGPFLNHPLTPQEQADLVAYFMWSDTQAPLPGGNPGNTFLAIGIGGALLLFGIMAVFWPRHRESLAERLRRSA